MSVQTHIDHTRSGQHSELEKKRNKERAAVLAFMIFLSIALLYLSGCASANEDVLDADAFQKISLVSTSEYEEVLSRSRSQEYVEYLNKLLYAIPGEVSISQSIVRELLMRLQGHATAQGLAPRMVFVDSLMFEPLAITQLVDGAAGSVTCVGEHVTMHVGGGISPSEVMRSTSEAAQILFTLAHEAAHAQAQECQRLFDGALASASTTAFVEGTASLIALEMLASMYESTTDATPKELVQGAFLYGLAHMYENDMKYRELRFMGDSVDAVDLARTAGYGPLSLGVLRFALQNPEGDVLAYIARMLGAPNPPIFRDLPQLDLTNTVQFLKEHALYLP